MIKPVTVRPVKPFTAKALSIGGLAIIPDDGDFHIYHEKTGLLVSDCEIDSAKNALLMARELIATGIDWENLTTENVRQVPAEQRQRAEKIVRDARKYAPY